MKFTWSFWVAIALTVGVGIAALYTALQRNLRRAHADRHKSSDGDIAALATAFEALEGELAGANIFAKSDPSQGEAPTTTAGAPDSQQVPLQPETLAAITAAATTFLGKSGRPGSAGKIQTAPQTVSPWSQQGRIMVETSHNLRAGEARRP